MVKAEHLKLLQNEQTPEREGLMRGLWDSSRLEKGAEFDI